MNSEAKTTCTVDYASRVKDAITVGIYSLSGNGDKTSTFSSSLVSAQSHVIGYNASAEKITLNSPTGHFGIGSRTPNAAVTASYEFSPNLKTQLQEQGLTYETSGEIEMGKPVVGGNVTDLSGSANTFKHFFANVQTGTSASSGWVRLASALKANTDDYDIAIKITIITEYETAVRYLKVNINEATMVLPSSINISNGSLVF